MTYTYKATLREGDGFDSRMKLRKTVTGIVLRSDGVTVLTGNSYFDSPAGRKSAQAFVNMQVGRFRKYQERHGECWYDRRAARLAHEKAREKVRKDTGQELANCAVAGARAAAYSLSNKATLTEAEDGCPFGHDTAQGVVWLQSLRLTWDRLNDYDAEFPAPTPE